MIKRLGIILARAVAVALIVVGLFMLGVFLSTPNHAAQAIYATPIVKSAPLPDPGSAINGVLASFTALIPESFLVDLPIVIR